MLREGDAVENILSERHVNALRHFAPLFCPHNFAEGPAGFDASDVFRKRRIEFVRHAASGADSDVAHSFEVVSRKIGACTDPCETDATQMEEVVVEMPRFLKDFVAQIHHRLAVIHPRSEIERALESDFVSTEGEHVDFCQIAEALIAEKDFYAWIPFQR